MTVDRRLIDELFNVVNGKNIMYVCKYIEGRNNAFNEVIKLLNNKLQIFDIRVKKSDNAIYIGNGSIKFVCFDDAYMKSKGYRGFVMYDKLLQNDMETFSYLKAINRSANGLEEAFKEKEIFVTDKDGNVTMTCVPYREGYVEHVKSGILAVVMNMQRAGLILEQARFQ